MSAPTMCAPANWFGPFTRCRVPAKSGTKLRVECDLIINQLDRAGRVEVEVHNLPDRPHPSATELPDDPIPPVENLTGSRFNRGLPGFFDFLRQVVTRIDVHRDDPLNKTSGGLGSVNRFSTVNGRTCPVTRQSAGRRSMIWEHYSNARCRGIALVRL